MINKQDRHYRFKIKKKRGEVMDIKRVEYNRYVKDAMAQVPKGAFLATRHQQVDNVMSIGWVTFGSMWGREIVSVGLRPNRYTFELLEKSHRFSLSIPLNQSMKEKLTACGSMSGRGIDKFEACGLIKAEGYTLDLPVVEGCHLYYECEVLSKNELVPEMVADVLKDRYYPEGNYHMLYYGEVKDCYYVEADY